MKRVLAGTLATATLAASSALSVTATAQSAQASYLWSGCEFSGQWVSWGMSQENKAEWNPIFQRAAATWNMTYLEMEEAINFGPPAIGKDVTDFGVTKWAGQAPYFMDCDPLTSKHNQMQFIQINTRTTMYDSDAMKQSTAAHEFGHVLGLRHPNDQVDDPEDGGTGLDCVDVVLMNHYFKPRERCNVIRPMTDDITGVSMLYDDNAGDTRVSTAQGKTNEHGDLTQPPSDEAIGVYLDWIKGYDSVEEAAADASAELVVKPTGESHVEYIGGGPAKYGDPVPFTVTEAMVISAGEGDFERGDIVKIRQDGNDEQYAVNAAAILHENAEYLVFLEPWFGPGGAKSDQHLIVGGQAAWKLDSEGNGHIASGGTHLPRAVSVSHHANDLRVALAD